MAQSKIYYVSPTAKGSGDGSSWDNTTTLSDALDNKAKAGDQIWVQGFEQITSADQLYIAPTGGFSVKSGVQLYGGFAGTETKLTDRVTLGKPYQMKYRSVLSGDINRDDKSDNTNLIFPANGTRSDNATHVLSVNMAPTSTSGNNNAYPTVINGFTIAGGHAVGTDAAGKGGGIYISGDNSNGGNFRIERCFLFNNYATQGGAVYVDAAVKNVNNGESLINQCVVYNNAAGERAAVENQGGGIYLAGAATVVNTSIFNNENGGLRISSGSKVVNSTIARNTGAGVDMTATSSGTNVYNSIIWGNTFLSVENQPGFKNSAFHEVTVADADAGTYDNGNVYVAKENRESASGPMFDAPSVKTSYDRDFDWRQNAYPLWSWNVLEGSVMIDKGDNGSYNSTVYGNEDMAGKPRTSGTNISIGAYEYQYLPTSRIRYVKPGGTGDGLSWDNASGNIQNMIDELANNANGQAGEVWVAAGIYTPQSQLISGTAYSASFRMRDGISVYGGFNADDPETSKFDRQKGTMPWDFTKKTILQAAYYDHNDFSWTNNKWTLTSDSRHVVWFAPMSGESDFANVTTLDGFTIEGGYAQGGTGMDDFMTDRGAGVYMDGANAYLSNCIVKENYATGNGGGVYLKNGRVQTSLIYNNNADADGGAVYVENRGLVYRSMLANNSALNGAGVYLHNVTETSEDHPEYLILSTCVVSNNTVRGNGAVYCDKGGVLMQNTITNNNCVTATDATNPNASQTGGIYIDEYALVVNSVLWNNQMGVSPNGTNIPMYARNPSADKVKFLYNAISGVNNAIWNNTLQEQTLSLVDENAGVENDGNSIGPRFIVPAEDMKFDLDNDYGVQSGWKDGIISYYWKPVDGSNLWARGMALGQLPDDVVLMPELDIEGNIYAQKPAAGAFVVKATTIKPEDANNALTVYVDVDCTEPEHQGDSWATAYRSLNNAISYLASLDAGTVDNKQLVVRVLEGDLWPRYSFTNNDPKTATITVPATQSGQPIEIYGGYHRNSDGTVVRDPLTYRSIINGNTEGKDITQGLYHCITVEQGANVVFDGFHVINGYAAGEASRQYGAGLLAHTGSTVTVRNCIFENNTAQEGAAIDARDATLTMQNCVVNNNTNTTEDASVINAKSLKMEYVTVVNNVGAAPENTNNLYATSFSAGNTSNNTQQSMTVDATQFTNPTKNPGATLGFDTYLGGYSSFQPTNQNLVVNVGETISGINQDITLGARSLGGAPDLGAYEADLPADGTVIYVRTTGDDNNDGLAWNRAKKTITAALNATTTSTKEVWVAKGIYTENVTMKEGVNVYGGFSVNGNPKNELDGVNRDISNSLGDFETIIDGNNNGRVLTQPEGFYKTETTWEGFIIQKGRMSGYYSSSNGAGVYLRTGGKLKNCLIQNNSYSMPVNNEYKDLGGGGLYIQGGTVDGCIIRDNKVIASGYTHLAGAGVFMSRGTLINSIIVDNSASNNNNILGAAAYIQNAGTFYNCTFAYNYADARGNYAVVGGIWDDSKESKFYNCIFWGNAGNGNTGENTLQVGGPGYTSGGDSGAANKNLNNCYASIANSSQTTTSLWNSSEETYKVWENGGDTKDYYGLIEICKSNQPFDESYQLLRNNTGLNCINKGNNTYVESNNIFLDAAGVNRIQYCTVDKGAYESTNAITFEPDNNGVYYVTQNGAGVSNASSEANAACASELQRVLHAAGERAKTGQTAIVKIAGYGQDFVYHANTLSDQSDPQSYTYVIPYGVTVMGGFSDQDPDWDNEDDGYKREPMTYATKLSAINNSSELEQEVNGYHTVTFGEKPEDWTGDDQQTIIDGVWLTDGSATSLAGAGNPNTRGGGAIVPSGAHVRNCVVMDCEAIEGGGLYLMPGATVSGTLVMNNSAEDGGGVYADNTNADENSRAHILSSTIAGNSASTSGGGLYMEDGAVMNVNTVIFGNKSGSDKNVSGATNTQFADNKLSSVYGITDKTDFYPFNDCFVETQEMPSDFENTSLESDSTLYFTGNYYQLKDYSLLIKHGVKTDYQDGLETTFNVTKKDMQNILRDQEEVYGATRLDAGAFAYDGGILPGKLFTRIFVSQTTNVTLPEGSDMNDYLGRSFYTSFSTLEDALGYIRSMRGKGHNDNFEILIAGGTYKPSNERTTNADVPHDQRLYSFEVPQGVSIYGGFDGTEDYGSLDEENTQSKIPTTSGSIQVNNMGDITKILSDRHYSDFNQNGINEPWELANQTILSGQINASSDAQRAYHVVFTKDAGSNPVVLDGLTVMYGQTDDALSYATNEDEQGRGGGIYSNGVTYTISRCRLLNNTAVRGGAVFVRNADLNLSGCILAGNKTVENKASDNTLASRGGAAYVSGISKEANLRAVNTLWANNESADEGGAIGTNYAEGISSQHDPLLYIMNNTFVRNKATTNPVLYNHNGKSHIVNTLIWGNWGDKYLNDTNLSNITDVSHCASDVDYVGKFAPTNTDKNILLSTDNMNDEGPRFTNPSTTAGVAGNSASSLWNPAAISVVTDAGDGTEHTATKNPDETDDEHKSAGTVTGAYQQWFKDNTDVTEAYITRGTYSRYSGPRGQNNEELCKPIDIGLYEYQYVSNFSTMPAIYVDTLSRGTGSGNSWANATDDLRGAIVGAANPTDNVDKPRVVYIRDGNYSWNRTSAGSAYILNMQETNNISLTLKGSCTGSGEQQDFSKPTILRNDGSTTNLISVSANSKPVTFEGFTFINDTGTGMDASTGSKGSLTLKNCGFRISPTGLNISGNSGKMLIYNTLFADGGTGLNVESTSNFDNITLVNTTFANNSTADMSNGLTNVYNSVWWNNKTQNMPSTDRLYNKVFSIFSSDNDATTNNADIQNGPNFVDPLNDNEEIRDYHIRPSVQLLNKGSNDNYINNVVKVVSDENATEIPSTEVDLGNNARLVDNDIDIGAYEYEAPLQPIVYVKPDLTGAADGKSWETALGDLQGAVDLAGLYALNHQSETEDVNGYVFVHGDYHDTGLLNLSLGNTKVYGGMNDERSSTLLGDNYTDDDVKAIVSDLLGKRKGMLENTNRSSLENVTISAGGVVDGFVVNGTATVNDGALSTSIVTENGSVTGMADGLLYNSLVLGDGTTAHPGNVSGVKAVNVTATGTIADVTGNGNNRASVTETNTYVTDDYWEYQLMETSTDIDPDGDRTDISNYMTKVGHSRDLIGNKRIRNTVDNGCFETWNICEDMTSGNVITSTDYPVGKSVVYVRKGQELKIENADGTLVYKDEASAFNPGFLLLEHQAGLRGNGNYISLTNLAVERDVAKGGNDLAAMPFKVTSISSYGTDGTNESYELKRYSGSKRAAYDYTFDSDNGGAWTDQDFDGGGETEGFTDQDFSNRGETEGFLIENTSDNGITVRFSGNSYNEDGNDKSISLMKYNFNEPWTSATTGGNRFTHKENMSWNLFGSPYLCAMNYSDLQYGRVLYGYKDGYQTVKTYGDDGAIVYGHIPAGSAVFTQTATLRDEEIFTVKQPSGSKSGDAFAKKSPLSVAVYPAGAVADNGVTPDILQLGAVPASEARNEFDMSADGVKWMADGEAQIYATRSGGRYSLLSAVSIDGKVAVGVTVPEPGMYTIAVPDDCLADGYESVVLEDALAGRSVNLLEGGYDFTTVENGDIIGRFNISFNRKADADGNIRAYFTADDMIRVEGVEPGDNISVYSVDGMRVASVTASSNVEDVRASVAVVAIVKAGGKTVKIRK